MDLDNLLHDIGIIKLDSPVNSEQQVALLPLAESSTYPSERSSVFVAAWPDINVNGTQTAAANLMDLAKFYVYNKTRCENRSYSNFKVDWQSQICAGSNIII